MVRRQLCRQLFTGLALSCGVIMQASAVNVPSEVICLLEGEVNAFDKWHASATSLVEITRVPGRVDLVSYDGTYTQWAYADYDGMTIHLCENELDLTLGGNDCLIATATPRQYESGVKVEGRVGGIWRGRMRCELPLTY